MGDKLTREEKANLKKAEIVHQRLLNYQKEKEKEPKIAPADAYISLQHINKIYDNHVQAVFDFNLNINKNEFIVFVGPSGCGKSTTLRMIAGLESITSGDYYIDGVYANYLEPKDRDVAMVFQSYALYPHMTVYKNMAFGLKMRHVDKQTIDKKVRDAAEILEISQYLKRKPAALSGGQRQRVALGRAIVRNAKVFLMDEPLSNLDAKLRVQMRSEIVALHKKIGATTIYVTHDQTEAMTMASRIVVMKSGKVQQIGTPKEIYKNPSNLFVATFIGSPSMNILNANYKNGVIEFSNGYSIKGTPKFIEQHDKFYKHEIELSEKTIKEIETMLNDYNKQHDAKKDTLLSINDDNQLKELRDYVNYCNNCLSFKNHPIVVGIRPEDIVEKDSFSLCKTLSNQFEIQIEMSELLGSEYHVHSHFDNQKIIAKFNGIKDFDEGNKTTVAFNLGQLKIFDPRSERNYYYEK